MPVVFGLCLRTRSGEPRSHLPNKGSKFGRRHVRASRCFSQILFNLNAELDYVPANAIIGILASLRLSLREWNTAILMLITHSCPLSCGVQSLHSFWANIYLPLEYDVLRQRVLGQVLFLDETGGALHPRGTKRKGPAFIAYFF